MTRSILVPVDGSEHSRKALEFACELARARDAKLHLLHVPQGQHADRTMVLGAAAITVHASQAELEAAGAKVLDAAEALAREHGVNEVESEVAAGDPAKVVVDVAASSGADAIVMGSRGLGDLSGLVLGSVSHKVNHLAPCTCVTVR